MENTKLSDQLYSNTRGLFGAEFLSLCFGQINDGAVTKDDRQGAQLPTSPALQKENNSCISS